MLQANIKLAVNVQWIPPKCLKFLIRLQIVLNTEDETWCGGKGTF